MPTIAVLEPALHCNTDAGLPIDHAVMARAATVGLWLVRRRMGAVAAVAAVVMGCARVYVGAHYLPPGHLRRIRTRRGSLRTLIERPATGQLLKREPI